jgi:hypothetical protein
MEQLLPAIFILFVLVVVAAVINKALAQKSKAPAEFPYQKEPTLFTPAEFPYQKEPTLFTPAERSFLGVLEQAVGDQFRIMGKVRLADVIRVRPGMNQSEWQKAFNRIQSKHLDFVACDPNDLSIQFAVELDDQSHRKQGRQDRDAFLDAAMEKAGVPLVHFPAKASYSIQEVWNTLDARLNPPEDAIAPDGSQPDGPSPAVELEVDEAKKCSSCGGDMLLRKASRGKNAGQEFWGCSNYPKCRKILPVE